MYNVYIAYIHFVVVMKINILISNSSGVPIYEQIYTQIKTMILNGTLKENEALPSMRILAKELRISLITTKRAYEELEKDGFIVSFTGKGSFVCPKNTELIREENLKKIDESFRNAVLSARQCNISLKELSEILEIIYNEEE